MTSFSRDSWFALLLFFSLPREDHGHPRTPLATPLAGDCKDLSELRHFVQSEKQETNQGFLTAMSLVGGNSLGRIFTLHHLTYTLKTTYIYCTSAPFSSRCQKIFCFAVTLLNLSYFYLLFEVSSLAILLDPPVLCLYIKTVKILRPFVCLSK